MRSTLWVFQYSDSENRFTRADYAIVKAGKCLGAGSVTGSKGGKRLTSLTLSSIKLTSCSLVRY